MQNNIFTSLPLEQLKIEISKEILERITPILQGVNNSTPPTELLTRKEASKLLGVSLPTLLDWTNSGKIIGYRIASRVRYKRSELVNSLSQIKSSSITHTKN
jgi:excisionase family DNA binding protein